MTATVNRIIAYQPWPWSKPIPVTPETPIWKILLAYAYIRQSIR